LVIFLGPLADALLVLVTFLGDAFSVSFLGFDFDIFEKPKSKFYYRV